MSYIKFKKDHPAGIKKDAVVKVRPAEEKKYISEGYADEASKEDFDKYKKNFVGRGGADPKALSKRSKEAREAVNGTEEGTPNKQAPRKEKAKS